MDFILNQQGLVVYVVLFLALLGGACGLPIPEDIPLIAGGITIHKGQTNVFLTAMVCYVAIILGDLLIFTVGRKLGPKLFSQKWFKKRFSSQRIDTIKLGLEKRSLPMIFLARHLFYLRTLTFLTCGAVKMKTSRFLFADALAALVSVPVMLSLGYFAAENYERVMGWLEQFELAGKLLGAIILVAALGYFLRKRYQQQAS